ncbi:GUN4 domain-containing protein [Leptothoe kymatousa]|uniref:GUN4 domain-containing protein n=1 Tax=Leptothoe kymatousa TAU-MAC 1615 TaxID=2364775 RepID=A0ABS5Y3I4_9CYAN|nr:GUN4 domain-containing protein [Leptothoe kymatousa]MBT9312398.1 GUN4 domain-containing protein [Leptothoe kymatousa TAU-MAC 1615]
MTSGSQPPSPESKFVARLINTIIRITPVGGSGWILVHFALTQEWIKAILMFPVLVATGFFAHYTEGFIVASNEKAGAMGKRHNDNLATWLGRQNRRLQWAFAKTDQKFARQQAVTCRDYKAEGIADARFNKIPQLEEVYVPLGLNSRVEPSDLMAGFAKGAPQATEDTTSIWDLLQQTKKIPAYRRLVILARGGYGKTTLLRHIAYRYGMAPGRLCRAKQVPRLVPILIYLRDWRDAMAREDAPDLATLITQLSSSKKFQLDRDWAERLLRQNKALVMIDGFDEVATDQCEPVSAWINRAVGTYGETALFLLTSRPAGYDRYSYSQSWTAVSVKPFDEDQRNLFINRWYTCQETQARPGRPPEDIKELAQQAAQGLIDQIEQRSELSEMTDNPLLLCMVAAFYRSRPGRKLPLNRLKLYQGFCQMLLEDRPDYKGIDMALPADEAQAVLQGVAWEMVKQAKIELPSPELHKQVQRLLARETDVAVAPKTFITEVEEISELFVRRLSADEVEFAHRSFQEYLAAREVKKQGCEHELLNLGEDWEEVAVLYAGLVKNPSSLIEALVQKGGQKALDLAYRCWLENHARVPDAVFALLMEQSYQLLEGYMVAGEWQKADQYTYRVMCQVLKKSVGSGFSPKELLSFPCKDLKRIDGLWVNHSRGKFGFSVQKEIWVQCGGKLDGKWDFEIYKKLGVNVGWCDFDVNWYKYGDLSFEVTDNTPVGHLPICGGWKVVVIVVFSHPDL